MGVGEGHGEGRGEGHGEGHGNGKGESDENVVIGSAVAIGLTVFMCVCGIPLICAGVVMVLLFADMNGIYIGGIAIIAVSSLLLVVGIIFIILICTGVIGQKPRPVQQPQVITTVQGQYPPGQYPPVQYQQAGYPPAGYPPGQYPASQYPQAQYPATTVQPGGQPPVTVSYPDQQAQYKPQQP